MPMLADPFTNCRFYVQISDVTEAVFTEVSGLQIETAVTDYEEGGENSFVHRVPGRTKIGNVTLKSGMTGSNAFFKWYREILRGRIAPKQVDIVIYENDGSELSRWTLLNAYPVKWVGPQLSAEGKVAAVETLELAHQGISLG